jgi:hypothetical protein
MVTTSVIVGPLYIFSQIILSLSQILSRGAWIEIYFCHHVIFRVLYAFSLLSFCYLNSGCCKNEKFLKFFVYVVCYLSSERYKNKIYLVNTVIFHSFLIIQLTSWTFSFIQSVSNIKIQTYN